MDPNLLALETLAGIHFLSSPNMRLLNPELALDAQVQTVTSANSAIPALLTTFVDPKIIKILLAPRKAAQIVGGEEVKKGDWLMETAMFPIVELTGEVSSYGDYSNNGRSDANANFVQRQSYNYQTVTEWGEKETARMNLTNVNWASVKSESSVNTLLTYQNKTYFYGVAGLQNYGLLNDPNLYAPITPATKAAGGVQWIVNGRPNATALEVVADIQSIYYQLQQQANGLVDLESKLTLVMSPTAEVALTFTNTFNNPVRLLLKTIFPNMRFETAPQYATASGQFVQLIAEDVEGQRTVDVAFTEKLRAHAIVVDLSSYKQKKSQGTWGAIIYRPFLIASMLGV